MSQYLFFQLVFLLDRILNGLLYHTFYLTSTLHHKVDNNWVWGIRRCIKTVQFSVCVEKYSHTTDMPSLPRNQKNNLADLEADDRHTPWKPGWPIQRTATFIVKAGVTSDEERNEEDLVYRIVMFSFILCYRDSWNFWWLGK